MFGFFGSRWQQGLHAALSTFSKFHWTHAMPRSLGPGSKQVELRMRSSFPARRCLGDTNIDLWTDGDIYLVDPLIGKPPPLKTLKQFIEFICHGEQGLQGYTYKLMYHCVHGLTPREEDMEMQCRQLSEEVLLLRGKAVANNSRVAQDLQMERMRCVDLEKPCTDLRAEIQAVRDSHA